MGVLLGSFTKQDSSPRAGRYKILEVSERLAAAGNALFALQRRKKLIPSLVSLVQLTRGEYEICDVQTCTLFAFTANDAL